MSTEKQAALEAEQITTAHQNEMALELAQRLGLEKQQAAALVAMQAVSLRAGRIQAAKLINGFAECLTVSQIRELKATYKEAGITWAQACQQAGISHKTADRYLAIADDLGDEFMTNVRHLGVSIRALEQARALPEPVKQKLIAGQMVDPKDASKEQLTQLIRDLSKEHAQAEAEAESAIKKETRAKERAEDKAKALADENEALREGLPAEDRQALVQLQEQERATVAFLVRVKNTLDLGVRDPHFVARLTNSLELIAGLAEVTANVVTARAQGIEPNEDQGAEVRELNEMLAEADNREPHPGV